MTVQHVDAPIIAARNRENIIVEGEIIRHRRLTRWIHWSVALTFFVSVFSGMPIWMPMFGWMAVSRRRSGNGADHSSLGRFGVLHHVDRSVLPLARRHARAA